MVSSAASVHPSLSEKAYCLSMSASHPPPSRREARVFLRLSYIVSLAPSKREQSQPPVVTEGESKADNISKFKTDREPSLSVFAYQNISTIFIKYIYFIFFCDFSNNLARHPASKHISWYILRNNTTSTYNCIITYSNTRANNTI